MKDDYINFTFNGINSDELGLTRVSNGSRYTDSLTPSFKDTTVEIEGANGVIYFKTNYGTKEITVLTAFDHITEPQLRRIRQVFSGNDVHELSFYEAPYKVYNAKVSSAPNFEFVTFLEEEKETTIDPETGAQVVTEKTVKVFKGECSISFVVFDSFAHTPSNGKFLDSSTYNEYTNLNEWAPTSGLLEEKGEIDTYSNDTIELYNPGDVKTNFDMYIDVDSTSTTDIEIDLHKNGNPISQLTLDMNAISKPQLENLQLGIYWESKTGLLYWYKVIDGKRVFDFGDRLNYRLGNDAIKNGETLIKIPTCDIGECHFEFGGPVSNVEINYNYLYF